MDHPNHSAEDPQDSSTPKEKSKEPSRFEANNLYFTISVYAVGVIFIGALIIKVFLSWSDTVAMVENIIGILMPFIIGALIAFILNPATRKIWYVLEHLFHLKNEKVCKLLSIAITYVCVIGLIAIIFFGIVPQLISSITDLVNYLPQIVNDIYHFVDNLEEHFPELDMDVIRNAINNALPDMIAYVRDFAGNLVPALYQISLIVVQWLLNLVISVIVSIYMLADKKPLKNSLRSVVYAFVPVSHVRIVKEVLQEAYRLFSSFFIGKAVDSAIIGCLCFLCMTILQIPYAVLISVIVGITNMIPYFGPFIGAVPSALILLLVSPVKSLIFLILIVILQQFDGLILGPKILGGSTGLKPLWIIVAITVGGSIGGVLGMFLGVPTVAFLRYLANRLLRHRLSQRHLLKEEEGEPLA
jgi:predicted PurR-regulated permease PerM